MSLTFTDLFCGAGGSSTGLVSAGMKLVLAANHSRVSIRTHGANYPDADHICEDINAYDMRRLPKTDVLWASPICTEVSPAGGRRRRPRGQSTLGLEEEGAIESEAFVRTRATAYDVIRATEVHRYTAVLCENVVEFVTDWELFDWWRTGMHQLGYTSQIVSVSSAHVHGPDNPAAPQWRDRIYVVFVRRGVPQPDLAPRPRAWCAVCEQDVEGVQSWRNGASVGKFRQQYDYRCPNTRCRHGLVEPYVRPAASVIDWSDVGVRIGDRAAHRLRPLAASTWGRIRTGLDMLGRRPQILTVNRGGHTGRAYPPEERPLSARTVKIGDALLVPSGGTWNTAPTTTAEPMRTRLANPRGFEALVTPAHAAGAFVLEYRRNGGQTPATRPLSTISAQGNHHGLVIPYRKANPTTTGEPLRTLSTVDSAGLVTAPAIEVEDCHYRMVQPREQLLAQRFPDDYIVHGTKGEQTAQAGNAVSVNVAQWIGQRVMAALDSR